MGGRSAGMAAGPSSPTVYSVMWSVISGRPRRVPSEKSMAAPTPGGKNTVDCRAPSSSVIRFPLATCASPEDRSTTVACGLTGIMMRSSVNTKSPQGTRTRRCAGKNPSFSKTRVKDPPPLTTRSKLAPASSRVTVWPYWGYPRTLTVTPDTGTRPAVMTCPRMTAARFMSMVPGSSPV